MKTTAEFRNLFINKLIIRLGFNFDEEKALEWLENQPSYPADQKLPAHSLANGLALTYSKQVKQPIV